MTCSTVRKLTTCGDQLALGQGREVQICEKRKWKNMGCLQEEKFHIVGGFQPGGIIRGQRLSGWSYYIRAFDFVRDTPMQELGWSQWTSGDIVGGGEAQEVCGLHPHSFVCEKDNPPSDDEMRGEYKNFGSMELNKLEKCEADCCGDSNKCGLGESNIEGGMGYWMYTLEHPHVKWMGLAGVTHDYQMIGRTFLGKREIISCSRIQVQHTNQ